MGLFDGLPSRSSREWYEAACCPAAVAGPARMAGSGASAAEAASEADAAMAMLTKAVAMGYRDAGAFRTDEVLDPLSTTATTSGRS
jgi:hypothetical protein